MQKLMACLQRPEGDDRQQWNARVAETIQAHASSFAACGYALVDEDVAPAHLLEMRNTIHPNDAVLSSWSENFYALDDYLADLQDLGAVQVYSVTESTAIPCAMQPGRVEGMCQVAFLKKPAAQPLSDWLKAWLGDHTRVAIDTQSNFAYRQNLVSVPLPLAQNDQLDWPLMDAIVEENFPAIAMTSREAFFAAEDDPDKFEEHQQIMMQSCFKFIDFENFDCIPMSQIIIKSLS